MMQRELGWSAPSTMTRWPTGTRDGSLPVLVEIGVGLRVVQPSTLRVSAHPDHPARPNVPAARCVSRTSGAPAHEWDKMPWKLVSRGNKREAHETPQRACHNRA